MSVKHICYCNPSLFLVLDSKNVLRKGTTIIFERYNKLYDRYRTKSNQFVGVNVKKCCKHFFMKLIQYIVSIKNAGQVFIDQDF